MPNHDWSQPPVVPEDVPLQQGLLTAEEFRTLVLPILGRRVVDLRRSLRGGAPPRIECHRSHGEELPRDDAITTRYDIVAKS